MRVGNWGEHLKKNGCDCSYLSCWKSPYFCFRQRMNLILYKSYTGCVLIIVIHLAGDGSYGFHSYWLFYKTLLWWHNAFIMTVRSKYMNTIISLKMSFMYKFAIWSTYAKHSCVVESYWISCIYQAYSFDGLSVNFMPV